MSSQILSQIISHTPIWVWAILSFLIYRGVAASKDRTMSLTSAGIIPIVMLGLSLQGILTGFGHSAFALLSWVLSLLIVAIASWKLSDKNSFSMCVGEAKFLIKGSWLPFVLMMGIFCTKYVINVALAMQPQLHQNWVFSVVVCALFGVMNGLFMGKLLHIALLYKQSHTTQMSAC